MRIKQLPSSVANQIAAGEVIERPASVVKELLENALDAEADIITIEIGHGGLNQIKVSDNGLGIVADDLSLAIAAHATSKIETLDDLFSIESMGFRGEALASIASISHFSIVSKPGSQSTGMQLFFHNNTITLVPCPRSQGTTIEVKDIFFNAPVRKKFLKPKQYEFQAIEAIVKRFALSCPTIAIKLIHDDKCVLNLPATSEKNFYSNRVAKLLGKQFVAQAIEVNKVHESLQFKGWISHPSYQRSQNDRCWVYINGRMIKDKLINHAIKQAYESYLHAGRHPSCLLYITIQPQEIDVNVHPTKHEVRFQEPRLIHDLICSHLTTTLKQATENYEVLTTTPTTYQVKENQEKDYYVSLPLKKLEHVTHTRSPWMILHNRFALCTIKNQTYFLNLKQFQHFLLKQTIITFPLMSRPLLVPIYFSIPTNIALTQIEHFQTILFESGIQAEKKLDKLLVHTLPVVTPNLLLSQFLSAVFDLSSPTLAKVIDLLITYEINSAMELTQEQQENYSRYLSSLEKLEERSFIKLLSEEICEAFLNA